ncbi:MAG TPA: hypothetical protein DCE41_35660 [Cytophagales bacterium]|nr:hypothetical protein [Cytophagales bacterium]HAA21088.1 hypothetical protein [Cytophagales bacterium]HAP65156.1 hypothetical protein [Cytophagales bacterium]
MSKWVLFCLALLGTTPLWAQGVYDFDGKLVYEVDGIPTSIDFDAIRFIEVYYSHTKPWIMVTFQSAGKDVSYLLDGRGQSEYTLIDKGGNKTAYANDAEGIDFAAIFGRMPSWDSPFHATGRTRSMGGKLCREYFFATDSLYTQVWVEPNFNVKGQLDLQNLFYKFHYTFKDGMNYLPRGFVFSIASGVAGEKPSTQLNIVSREVVRSQLNLSQYQIIEPPTEGDD